MRIPTTSTDKSHTRIQSFREKFDAASQHLHCTTEQIVSLKFRDDNVNYGDYRDLFHQLENQAGVKSESIKGDFQGSAFLVGNTKTKIIVVQHETGLELLYISGSVASLISIIPVVVQFWGFIRKHHGRQHPPDIHQIETRRFEHGQLVEDRSNALGVPWAAPMSMTNTVMFSAAENIDAEIQTLRNEIRKLGKRLKVVEAIATKSAKSQPAKLAKRKK
jgi:hypothetical protein